MIKATMRVDARSPGMPAEFAALLHADIGKLDPAGLVPMLFDGGQVLTESRIINEYREAAYQNY